MKFIKRLTIKKVLVFNRRILRGMSFYLMGAGIIMLMMYGVENSKLVYYASIYLLVALLIDKFIYLSSQSLNFIKSIRKRVSRTKPADNDDKQG